MTNKNYSIIVGALLLGLAVCIGAFGAHGLKPIVTDQGMKTFQTGVSYHYYHGFGLLLLGLLKNQYPELKEKFVFYAFIVGITLFSFNCYFYAIFNIKTFAMIIPIGGVFFILGWFTLAYRLYKVQK